MGNKSVFVAVLLIGVVTGGIWMHGDNRARERYLDRQYEHLDRERDSVLLMKELGDAEFREYAAAVHEQSRIARNVQERLHDQELALVGAENGWIHLVIGAMVVTVIAVVWIGRSTNDRARTTIQNALGLPPAQMHAYLVKSQMAEVSSVPELAMGESGMKQPPPKMAESGQGTDKGFRPTSRNSRNNRGAGRRH